MADRLSQVNEMVKAYLRMKGLLENFECAMQNGCSPCSLSDLLDVMEILTARSECHHTTALGFDA